MHYMGPTRKLSALRLAQHERTALTCARPRKSDCVLEYYTPTNQVMRIQKVKVFGLTNKA